MVQGTINIIILILIYYLILFNMVPLIVLCIKYRVKNIKLQHIYLYYNKLVVTC